MSSETFKHVRHVLSENPVTLVAMVIANAIHGWHELLAGDAVSVALATGDITIAGTGTVSRVEGTHLLAFGHPLMDLGAVDLPMASSEVVSF